ncbi:dipeptide ABC transporter ATP-binding protein [Halovivax cerinus]|uniref:ABC transporter ATP-binding protein n=1 Tax=Halovivax cerinus TaxID=1487865 RepID=A0ABD5NPC5_9EURY
MSDSEPLVQVSGLTKHFEERSGFFGGDVEQVQAVDGVDLTIERGETFGLVGESGCGKSTLGRTILRLYDPTDGTIRFKGRDITDSSYDELRPLREEMQLVFQDPFSSLNPRRRVGEIVEEPLAIQGVDKREREERARKLLERVGLQSEHYGRYPHAFSGGQRQRIGIARSLIVEPDFIVADEPVSALDVSIQAQIINLLDDLKDEFDLALLIIAHDLSVVRYVADRMGVMYLGELAEVGPAETVFQDPKHPYTKALLSSAPIPDPTRRDRERIILEGEPPSPIDPPTGCKFRTRCPKAFEECTAEPELEEEDPDHHVSCHLY